MVTSTISIPELIWTIATAIGLFFNVHQLQRAVGDYLIVRFRKINSIREYAAITTMLMFASWTFVQTIFVLLGIIGMLTKSPNKHPNSVQYALVVGFVSVSVFLALIGYVLDARRQALIKKIEEIENFN